MLSNDILEDFISKLKKEKIQYFIFLAKKPSKKQKLLNPENDVTIAQYQKISQDYLMVLHYCLAKLIATGEFDPNKPWDMDDNEGEGWKG